ncbi:MAG TPA: SPOR domain-containing protein [Gammaproteobacteria bacterium]
MARFATTAVSDKVEAPLKQRLVGATVLVALGVIFIPMLLEGSKEDARLTVSMEIPPQPSQKFEDRLETPPKAAETQPLQPLDQATAPVKRQVSPEVQSSAASSEATSKTEKAVSRETTKDSPGGVSGQWIVQAGSFSREANATVLRDQLKAKGFKAFVENAGTSAGTVYRVRIGPVEEREAAEALVKRLNSSGNYHGMVMSYHEPE